MAQSAKKPASEAASSDILTVEVGDETLESTLPRLLAFLRAVGTRPEIQHALTVFGYDEEEHQRGWSLLHACSGYSATAASVPTIDRKVADAIATLDGRDEATFATADASLQHRAPSVHSVFLRELKPGRGAESVLFFRTLLDRLDKLAKGTLEGVTKAEAKAADAILVKRGWSASWREAHAQLVKDAESFGAPTKVDDTAQRELMRNHLRAARAFYEEWSRIARAHIRRKDYLILLGLASRKDRGAKKPAPPTT